jgi:hypothetical protein
VIEDLALDAFQAALIERMLGKRAAGDPALDLHRAWIDSFDPALTEAARTLVARWATS